MTKPAPQTPIMKAIIIDGAHGGGQLLRSSLTLSMVTGFPFHMTNIRGARKPKPGLMRQHLTCVKAAQEVCGATVEGAEIGSQELVFRPGAIKAGDYHFAIGTGGSTTLVLQTLIPALLQADGVSTVRIEGGTHNPMAPPFDFIDACYLPALRRMGVRIAVTLERTGFMQAGGGSIMAEIHPLKKWKRLALLERGEMVRTFGTVLHAHLPPNIAEREQFTAAQGLGWPREEIAIKAASDSKGPGSIIMLGAEYENITEVISAVAQMGRTAESVGTSAAKGLGLYLGNSGAVGVHLADQLLLPMALAGTGSFTTFAMSKHTQTHMDLIPKFLPVSFKVEELEQGVRLIKVTKGATSEPVEAE